MNRHTRVLAALAFSVAPLLFAGCHSSGPSRRVVTPDSGGMSSVVEPDGTVNSATSPPPVVKSTSFVDRHPLFYRPRDYWETSGNNTVVKAAAATFIGIPAGIFSETRQILTGVPPEPKY